MNTTALDSSEQELNALRQQNEQLIAQLQQREEYISTLEQQNRVFDLSLDLFCIAGFDGYFKRVNNSWSSVLGYTQAELLAQPFVDLVHPDDRDHTIQTWMQVAETKQVYQAEYRIRAADGSYRYFLARGVPILNADGSIQEWIGTFTDIHDRKQADTQLQEQEQFLRSIYDGVASAIFVLDVDVDFTFRYQGWNGTAEAVAGISSATISGKTPQELFGDELGTALHQRYTQCLVAGTTISYEDCIPLHGKDTYWLITLTPLQDVTGRIYRIIGTSTNISDRRLAEAQLQEQEQFFRTLYEGVEHTIVIVDVLDDGDFRFVSWNPTTEKLTKVPGQAVVGKTPEELLGEANGAIIRQNYQRCLKVGNSISYEEYLPFQGRDMWWLTTLNPLRDNRGRIYRLVITSFEITDRKQVEEALHKRAQREQLLNQLADQIRSSLNLDRILEVAISATWKLLQVDTCSISWYRTDAEEPYWEVVQEARNPDIPSQLGLRVPSVAVAPLSQRILDKEVVWINDVAALSDPALQQFLSTFGTTALLSLPIHTQSNEIIGFNCAHYSGFRPWSDDEVSLLRAVADQLAIAIDQATLYQQSRDHAHQMEQTLRELTQTQTRLVQSEKMSSLGQLVAGVAHEINNPVNFIYGNLIHAHDYTQDILGMLRLYQQHYPHPVPEIAAAAEAIDLDFLIEDLRKLLSSMKVGADRIRSIVASLRNFSRMDEAEFKTVDIHEGIDSTLMILQNRFKAKPDQPEIRVVKHYSTLPPVECFPGQLNQVFMNILVNAIDALEEMMEHQTYSQSPTIEIHTELAPPDRIIIRISDNGPGIPVAVQQRLFDPFFTTKPVGKGTGLGMSISYQIVTEKHNGSLHCASIPGQGTQFAIEIPVYQHDIKSKPYSIQ